METNDVSALGTSGSSELPEAGDYCCPMLCQKEKTAKTKTVAFFTNFLPSGGLYSTTKYVHKTLRAPRNKSGTHITSIFVNTSS